MGNKVHSAIEVKYCTVPPYTRVPYIMHVTTTILLIKSGYFPFYKKNASPEASAQISVPVEVWPITNMTKSHDYDPLKIRHGKKKRCPFLSTETGNFRVKI